MADLMRLSRPWLLAPLRSTRPSPASPIRIGLSRNIHTTSSLYAANRRKPARPAPSATKQHRDRAQQAEANSSILAPMTLVPPPVTRYPREPRKFMHMLWLLTKNRAQAFWATCGVKLMSQPRKFISRSKFKANRSAVVPVAKAMHVQMSEALAIGDRETLRRVCAPELFKSLAGTIDARPKGIRSEWELVRYNSTWYYPRLADWRVSYQPMQSARGSMKLVKQAVVSISSVQRLARYDETKGGAMVPGSERVRDIVEHIVLQAEIDQKTFESQPWRIWGNLSEMTYESYLDDVTNLEAVTGNQ
ncbi:Uu.00g113100.m01.CDS01 [Anthostomella pinea]|uniref:Uu.00g113100.m01.CDS01 n=1 Tax=Anthostomella pinea TaxID=933095 RepID=A0AAI8YGI9_9PEZI|nr:Uu.00g113100.m01.CDS01 [Anthostomella pinea]